MELRAKSDHPPGNYPKAIFPMRAITSVPLSLPEHPSASSPEAQGHAPEHPLSSSCGTDSLPGCGAIRTTQEGIRHLIGRGQLVPTPATKPQLGAQTDTAKIGKFDLIGVLPEHDLCLVSRIPNVFLDHAFLFEHTMNRLDRVWWHELVHTHPVEWKSAWDYYASDELAAALNTRLRGPSIERGQAIALNGQKISPDTFVAQIKKIAQDLPVGLPLNRVLSDGTKIMGTDGDTRTSCGAHPNTEEIHAMSAQLERGEWAVGSVLRENGLMSTSPGWSAHHELSQCSGIEFQLVVGPGVKGIVIGEGGEINDVILLPGQKMALLGTKASKKADRLIVRAVLLPTDFSGQLSLQDRQKLEFGQALDAVDSPRALALAKTCPDVLSDPNILAGHSAQAYAWLSYASQIFNRKNAHTHFELAYAIRQHTPASARDTPDWSGKRFDETLAQTLEDFTDGGGRTGLPGSLVAHALTLRTLGDPLPQ